ncbi:MAG: DUF547 domain-containing protein [Saprospiraceae bacterium]|nr:DUF547 domain-containing protein [Saprospiraceae bacterium]
MLFCIVNCAAQSAYESFNESYEGLINDHVYNNRVDYEMISIEEVDSMLSVRKAINLSALSESERIALDINTYNFLVIYKIRSIYPISSVTNVGQFFEGKFILDGRETSLDKLEEALIQRTKNPYIHLLLNCGAVSCPQLKYIDSTIELDYYIKANISDLQILQYNSDVNEIKLSKIFFWYKEDFEAFGQNDPVWSPYLLLQTNSNTTVNYLDYNWQLNDLDVDDYLIFYPTKLFQKGGFELKIFNNYYTQSDNGFRSNFFSSFIQLLIGTDKNFNIGMDVKLRSVNQGDVGVFSALGFQNKAFHLSNDVPTFSRSGVAAIGPRIRYQPFKGKGNINFLHAIYFVPMSDTEGNADYGYFDFQNVQIFNNVWYEKEFSVKRRLFLDVGFHIENLKLGVQQNENHFMQILLPITAIYSYFPNPETTFYVLGNYAQKFEFQYNVNQNTNFGLGAFGQIGVGAKYYLTDWLELEGLYTYFIDTTPGRVAHTFNIGFRFFK